MGEFDSTLGAVLIGGFIAAVLYGLTTLQTFLYSQTCKSDGPFLKSLIGLLWLLDTLHMIFSAHSIYHYLVTSFGQVAALLSPVWSLIGVIYLTSFNGIIVRIFLAHRIFVLCGRYRQKLRTILPVLAVTMTLVTFVTGWIFASKSINVPTFAELDAIAQVYLYITFASAAAADSLIAISLCGLLYTSRTGIKRTDSLLSTLIVITFNTGLITSAFALSCLVTYSIWPKLFIYVGMYFPLSKLYVNSLMSSLNARQLLRSRDTRSLTIPDGRSTRFSVAPPPVFSTPVERFSTNGTQKETGNPKSKVPVSAEVYAV